MDAILVGDEEIPEQQVFQATELIIEESKDKDARWLKKGKQCTYRYKGYTLAVKNYGLFQAIVVTLVNVYDENMNTCSSVFMKVMCATMKSYPDLDLKTLAREEIIEMNLPCRNICESAKAGYLEKVPKNETMINIF
ncbi:MAG: hypothetical protein ABFD07_08165 [Methanobacterium sp.]